jgi:hypothetical protein
MDAFADELARPIRDRLNALGYRAIIVTDEPLLRGSFDPESKVSAYIEASDAFVALCTHDDRVPGGTAQNIIDEIGRARTHPSLREVVCVLKEHDVKLPSNIAPAWSALDPSNPGAAFDVVRQQLEAWHVEATLPPASPAPAKALPAGFLGALFDGVGLGEHEEAERRVRELFVTTTKDDQKRVARAIFEYVAAPPEDGVEILVVASFLEAASRIDPSLVETSWIEQLASSADFQLRSSAATMLWDLSETSPGTVPLDLVARLAKPTTEDWYVFSPALAAAKQLALSRRSALGIILDLARSSSADDRAYAIRALMDIAAIDPALVPVEPVEQLARDGDSSVAEPAAFLLLTLAGITEAERSSRYGKFGL